jgi:deferrochelatase/peroxidase EfeB
MVSKSRGRGELSELTHVAPIKQGLVPGVGKTYADRLRIVLESFHSREELGFPGVIRLFRGIHTAQWAMLDGDTRLMLNVVFDGDLRGYLRALARDIPGSLGLVWSNCEGWRATHTDTEILVDFIERHQVRNNFFYAHFPKLTVPDVDALVRLRNALDQADATTTVQTLRDTLHAGSMPLPLVDRARAAWIELDQRNQASEDPARRQATKASSQAALKAVLSQLFKGDDADYFDRALRETYHDPATEPPAATISDPNAQRERAHDIQANVVAPVPDAHCARMLFYHFPLQPSGDFQALAASKKARALAARGWVQEMRALTKDPALRLTIGFTHAGLDAMGVDAAVLSEFPEAFRQGMDARASALGDAPRTADARPWTRKEHANETGEVHAVVCVYGVPQPADALFQQLLAAGKSARAAAGDPPPSASDTAMCAKTLSEQLGAFLDGVTARVTGLTHGSTLLGYQDLHMPLVESQTCGEAYYGVEYFGFRDGIGQPRLPNDTTPLDPHDPPASYDAVLLPHGRGLLKNATFMVARQLRQDSEGFWKAMKDHAGVGAKALAEQIIGRHLDGRRLGGQKPFDPQRDRHAFDPGQRGGCPLHSHARRMNPRTEADLGHNPQLMRRSLAYVRPDADAGYARGLMFIAFNADIETQFELMQRHWVQAANQVGASSQSRDVLAGHGTTPQTPAHFQAEAAVATELRFDNSFVQLEWGIYLFVPAREALNSL